MDVGEGKRDIVDPEVRAYVSSLVSALGGYEPEEGKYVLGDDALAVLRDLKRWLKLYDEKANRLDVARCLAESNLVGGDLLHILAGWPEDATDHKVKSKIALGCLELLVPLTWPIEKDPSEMTVNHHRHVPVLQIAQLGYKRAIINFDGARILSTAVRCALPSMALPLSDRSTRDEGIIKLVLYFLRNMVMIAPPPNVEYEGDEAEISRSATIGAFDYQDIFHLLLTVCSTMGEEFNTQDVVAMEILFHLVKGVNVEKLFSTKEELSNDKVDEFVRLRAKEKAMLRGYQKNAPTRHNRFGTTVWVDREGGKKSVVTSQAALTDRAVALADIDKSKKFKPPRKSVKGDNGYLDFNTPVSLNMSATRQLRKFVEEFLDSGFNPLFIHIRKAMDREAERILEYHHLMFFYLISWFLEAERVRRKKSQSGKGKGQQATEDVSSYALVAGVLNQETFVTLNRAMESNLENKIWHDLSAGMKCFTQILLTVQEMAGSPLEDDQEIAENILSRIFYEETTHDRVAQITRTYKDQGFGYLDATTEFAHNYMRILEQYSKQNIDLQVRSRRRIRRKKKAEAQTEEGGEGDAAGDSEAEDEARAERTSRERSFDFKRFVVKFLSQGCIDTFVSFIKYYNDLNAEQLKRAHRFFYRVAFKEEMSVMLFRVDIIALLYKMIKGPEGLDRTASYYKEWDELVKQLIRRCIKKWEERPELAVEMLFSKNTHTAHYLEYGYEKQTIAAKPRAAAELEVKPGMEWEQQVAVVVSALLDKGDGEDVQWIKSELFSAENERRSWEDMNKAMDSIEESTSGDISETPAIQAEKPLAPSIVLKPDNDTRRLHMFKNGYLRLLMKLIGIEQLGEDGLEAQWFFPSKLTADQIKQAHDLIKNAEFSPPTFDDGKEAADFIRRKSAAPTPRRRQNFDDEDDDIDDDEELFPAGGPTARKVPDALKEMKKLRQRRRRKEGSEDEDGPTDEQLEARREERRLRELEKRRKIKSELFVHDSDDESDEERDRVFFEQEEQRRQKSNAAIMKELLSIGGEKDQPAPSSSRKRQSTAISSDSDDESGSEQSSPATKDIVSMDSDDEDMDTPMSSPHARASQTKRQKLSDDDSGRKDAASASFTEEEEDGDEDLAPVSRVARQRVRAGFIVESSDEED
ncbi:timeless protein-domain-containing protein [Xylogone sp. PMI_703]|nr:timeless protein-domain-containing protein [Xylogone sp. PMI_703]